MFTVPELAALLQVSGATVYHLCEVGAVRHLIAGHAIVIPHQAVREMGVPDALIRPTLDRGPARLLTAVEAAQRSLALHAPCATDASSATCASSSRLMMVPKQLASSPALPVSKLGADEAVQRHLRLGGLDQEPAVNLRGDSYLELPAVATGRQRLRDGFV